MQSLNLNAWLDLTDVIFSGWAEESFSRKGKGSGMTIYFLTAVWALPLGTFLRQKTELLWNLAKEFLRDRSIPSPAHLADTNTFWRKPFSLQGNVFPPAWRILAMISVIQSCLCLIFLKSFWNSLLFLCLNLTAPSRLTATSMLTTWRGPSCSTRRPRAA